MRERRHIRLQKQVDHGNRREASPVQAAATTTPIFNEPPLVDASQTENGTPPPRDSASPALMAVDDQPSRIQIEIEYHPHSGKGRTIIPLDSTRGGESTSTRVRRQLVPTGRPPWAPFPSRADFTWAETVYMMPEATVAAQLKELPDDQDRGRPSKNYVVEFREHEFEATFEGEPWHFKFFYRDPWEWLLDLVSDPTLVDEIVWYPSRKYLVVDGVRQRLRDEAYNSDTLWEMQSALPFVPGIPHCLLPMLLWLDKGRVSSHTNMHPMILRPLFLRSKIRNASGNGGGELAGFMVQVRDRKDPADRSQAEKIRFAKFKRDVYHRVLQTVFVDTLRDKAAGVSLANNSNDDVYEKAKFERFKTVAESMLQQYGLHLTENAFWALRGTDAYKAISYDLLHSDDSGKWGKHIWPLLLDALADLGLKGMVTVNMAKVPRWPGLKHFDNVTTKDINDGQSWLDIEKCILPCVVQLLPKDSPFIHAIRAHLLTRMMMGLHCISEDQIKRKDTYQQEYGKQCIKLSEKYGKSFDFPKQHSLYHSTPDIRDKGPHSVYCTRVNEGFHQETREIYARLNKRNMTDLDAIREAMARIRMTLNQYDAEISERTSEMAERMDVTPREIQEVPDAPNEDHWRLGSPQNLINSRYAMKETVWIDDTTRQNFHSDLRSFVRNTFPEEPLREDGEEIITIRPFRSIYLHYTSLEDWTDQCDVLRCNPSFQVNHEERFDCVAINMDDDPLTFGRMLFLFECRLPSGRTEDIALVRLFKKSNWRPNTVWKNCWIFEDGRTIFILPRYFVRGAHLVNCFGCSKEKSTFYLDDVADFDWLLRAGN
ncbi:hypothetical protein DFH06DRAFT_1410572 [Mycena polygramma]|nr:hypothetical protein DFH06DRAFT_1410572 [Mycena polygramma]